MNRPLRAERDGERSVAKRLPIISLPRENKGKSRLMSQIHAKTDKLSSSRCPSRTAKCG